MKRTKSFEEVRKELWQEMSFWQKVRSRCWGVYGAIEDILHRVFGIGSHTEIGEVGAKKYFCMICEKTIDNLYWKEERKTLQKARKKVKKKK